MWTSYITPPNPANATDINNIFANEDYIRNKLISLGLTVDSLNVISADVKTPYADIADIYINIEKNLDIIGNNEYQSAYYIASVARGNYEPNRAEWQRWIDVLNDMHSIVTGRAGKWQYLLCTDDYPTINGNRILLRGENING